MAPGNTQTASKFAPEAADDKRIDLSIDGETTSIKLSSWVDGLGWCGQKTIKLEPEMLDVLHKLTGAARVRLRHQRMMDGKETIEGKILDFPV